MAASAGVALLLVGTVFTPVASAATFVQLGAATPFAVLAATAVTNVPTSTITGDVGLSPAAGSNYAGMTTAQVDGTIYTTNASGPAGATNDPALLTTAKNNLTTAYTTASGQTPTTTFVAGDNQLGGKVLVPGVYAFGHALTANLAAGSPLVLDGEGDADAVFIFQASSDLVTAPDSVVELENGAQACNVFWTVGSSATLNTGSTFVGTLMAYASASLLTDATVQGRILAETGAVTLDANTITSPPTCNTGITTTTTTTAPAGTTPTTTATTATGGTGGTGTGSGTGAAGTGAAGTTGGSGGSAAGAATGTGTSAAGTTSTAAVIPTGFPHTGLGGAAHSRYSTLIGLGVLALIGSGAATVVGVMRRRILLQRIETRGQG